MLTTILWLSVVVIVFLLVLGWFSDKLKVSHKRQEELHNRLQTLEDRFYHPDNYHDAFFRVKAKKEEDK